MENNSQQFDQLFRDKLGNLEVPYEPAHWAEMEAKLEGSAPAPASGSGKGSLVRILSYTAGAALIVAAGYFLYTGNDNTEIANNPAPAAAEQPAASAQQNEHATAQNDIQPEMNSGASNDPTAVTPSGETIKNGKDQPKNGVKLEEKIDKISAKNTQQIKAESQEFTEQKLNDNLSYDPKSPAVKNLDNKELKTTFSPSSKVVCVGDEVKFTTDRTIANASYFWNFGDGDVTSTKQNPKHTFNKPGTFEVLLMVSTGEKNSYTTTATVEVKTAPRFELRWDDSELTLHDPYTEFSVQSAEEGVQFTWKIDDISYQGKSVEHIFKSAGYHNVELIGSKNGCYTEKKENIYLDVVAICPIERSFTMNGDGLNDEFPAILSIIEVPFTMKIYNKMNQLVYETSDAGRPWNGRYNNNGEVVPADYYQCVIVTKDKYGREHRFAQNFSILK